MAAPSYYDNSTNTILDGTVASASDVENKLDDVATSFEDVAADVDNTLRFTHADFTDQVSTASAAGRANKVVGFNSSGNLELKADITTYVNASWSVKTGAYDAVAGDWLIGDTSGGGFTITLPAAPAVGATVWIKTTKDAQVNTLTLGRNGSNINGTAADLVIDVNYFEAAFVYVGASLGWSM